MTLTRVKPQFAVRACGHSVPMGRAKCPYCTPPRMSAEPLAAEFRKRASRIGFEKMTFEVASRLGMSYERIDRHIRRIVAGDVTKISFNNADKFCVALGGISPATLWPEEWEYANPVEDEPYGDENY